MHFAKIIINLSLDRTFDYIIPDELFHDLQIGAQVNVPFGKSHRKGYVVAIRENSAYPVEKLKKIDSICNLHPKIPDNLLDLGKWISEYYCCSWEQAVKALIPLAVRSGKISHKIIKHYYINSVEDAQKFLFEKEKRSPSRTRILKTIFQHPGINHEQLLKETNAGAEAIKGLVKLKLIIEEKRKVSRNPFSSEFEFIPGFPHVLTEEQNMAMEKIRPVLSDVRRNYNHTVLLHGVTGSGKTEIYLQAIDLVLRENKDSIVLVPEISLTPQTTERFMARFGARVSVLHSGLSEGERFDEWNKIYSGEVKIVVGARSALFAPFKNLGLIIVDEEHENSYKQEESPRYHARDVAVMRGYMEGAAVILGSATPSLESYCNSLSGKYVLARLTKRVDNQLMPKMRIVDMRLEKLHSETGVVFSRELVAAVYDRIKKGEQTIIFLNRRGFATQMICLKCGFVAQCPDCSITYTYHKKRACLSCHLCGSIIPAYTKCPECGTDDIRYSGLGTEKIESIMRQLFPHAGIARMDSDTMGGKKHMYEKTLREFRSGRIDILIGTQMIAKGLHFPNVTLVGIIYADLSLHMPDFRAGERTFQLLTQVAGRAGRGEVSGEVYIQTYTPNHPAIQYALKHDYENFCIEEYQIRKEMKYPPCGHLFAVHFRGSDEKEIAKFADEFLESLRPFLNPGILVTGPVPPPVSKAKGKYRYMIIFRGGPMKEFREKLRLAALHEKRPKNVELYIDIDALNLM